MVGARGLIGALGPAVRAAGGVINPIRPGGGGSLLSGGVFADMLARARARGAAPGTEVPPADDTAAKPPKPKVGLPGGKAKTTLLGGGAY